LLALEERLAVLQKTNVVPGDSLNEVLSGAALAEGDAKMVRVVKGVEEIAMKGI